MPPKRWTSCIFPPGIQTDWPKGHPQNFSPARKPNMPSAVRKRSYGSVTVFSLDRAQVEAALQTLVETLRRREEVLAVVCFGSWARNEAGVGSDVDLLVVLRASEQPFLERIDAYLPATFPVDLNLFPYTLDEIRNGQPLARTALQTGRVLWTRIPLNTLRNDAS